MIALRIWCPALLVGAVACGGGGGTPDVDAAPRPDATPGPVVAVSCGSATVAATITAPGLAYSPVDSTVSVGDVVEFHMPANHDVNESTGAFHVAFGGDDCFRFDEVADYTFTCSLHGFSGTLTVQ